MPESTDTILREIRDSIRPRWTRYLYVGLLQGFGFVVGTILTAALLGWALAVFGVIPGFGDIAHRLQDILNRRY
jgi:hypothetical protein